MGNPLRGQKSRAPIGVGTTRKTDGRWTVTTDIRNVKVDHYEPGEKKSASHGVLSIAMKVRIFDAWVYGFPPGKATINMPVNMARIVFKPLIDEMLKPIEQVPNRKQLRNIKLFGCTDRVGGSKNYNDKNLRQKRADAFKSFLLTLLPSKGQHPKITAMPLQKNHLPYADKGGSALSRSRNRGVGVLFTRPPVPKGCYEPGTGPTRREALDMIKKAIEGPQAKKVFSGLDYNFMNRIVNMLLKGGNDEYITEGQVRIAINNWGRELKKKISELKKLPAYQRDKLGKQHGMNPFPGFDAPMLPKKTVEREGWYAKFANKILLVEKPQLFSMTSISLITEFQKLVRDKCRETSLIPASLTVYVQNIKNGRKSVSQAANWAKAMLAGFIGSREAETFIERGVQKWIIEKEKNGNSIYSIHASVYGKK